MCRIITIAAIILLSVGSAVAQPAWHKTDSLTYRFYLDKNWGSVLRETRHSLHGGVDFFYLRLRAGKAAYELKKYREAVSHFSKAYSWNTSDEFVNYWYYYSLVMAGRADEADWLANRFSDGFRQQMKIAPRGNIHSVQAESQLTVNTGHQSLVSETIVADGSYINYRNVMKQQLYKGVSLGHKVSSRFNLFHSFSHLNIQRTELFQSDYPSIDHTEVPGVSQFNYYLQGWYLLHNGWTAYASGSFLFGNSESHWVTFSNNPVPIITAYNYSISDRIFTLGLSKDFWWARPKITATFGKINGFNQFQLNGQLTFYPFADNYFYLSSDFSAHNDDSRGGLNYVLAQKIGIKTGPLWLIVNGAFGPIKNFSASDGYVVYNMPEKINHLYGGTVYLPLLSYKLELTARFLITGKEAFTYHYLNTTDYQATTYKFGDQNFLIGVKWNF